METAMHIFAIFILILIFVITCAIRDSALDDEEDEEDEEDDMFD